MRILFLTNFYPPYARGGEGYSCQQVAEGLRRRGHEIHVLTSSYGYANGTVEEKIISRRLLLEMEFQPWTNSLMLLTRRKAREKYDLQVLRQTLHVFEPHIVFIWGMWNLPRSLPWLVEQLYPERVVYRFATYWPALPSQYTAYWLAPGRTRLTRVLRRAIRPLALALAPREENEPPLEFRHIICVSKAVRQQLLAIGVDASQARVIYTGLDTAQYRINREKGIALKFKALRLLYGGRLATDKGVHTAIQALHDLINRHALRDQVLLTVAGSGDLEYEAMLRKMVTGLSLGGHVTFLGQIPNEKMAALYRDHDVLLVPSIWPEPFARVVLEGMASGLVVLATAQGGTAEIIRNGENGLLFRAGDASELADKVAMLCQEPAMRFSLAATAQQTVSEEFGERNMLDQIESYLLTVVDGS